MEGDSSLHALCLGNLQSGCGSCNTPFPIEPSPCTAVTWVVCGWVGKEERQVRTEETYSFAFWGPLAEELSIVWSIAETKLNCLQGDRIFFHCPIGVSSSPCSQGPSFAWCSRAVDESQITWQPGTRAAARCAAQRCLSGSDLRLLLWLAGLLAHVPVLCFPLWHVLGQSHCSDELGICS